MARPPSLPVLPSRNESRLERTARHYGRTKVAGIRTEPEAQSGSMWPTRLFVHRPTLVFVALALLAVAGAVSLATIVQQQFPNIDFPTITVRASYPGGSTTQIRDAIVKPIEDAIAGAPNLDHINTTVQQGQATISAVFSLTSNKTTDLVQVQQRLLLAQADLPKRPARADGRHLRSGAGDGRHAGRELAHAAAGSALGDRDE